MWYTSRSVVNMKDVESDLLTTLKTIEHFSDSLDEVHSMEMFYGEPVLQDLINHSRSTINDIVDLLEKYYEVRTEEIEEENTPPEEEEPILY